MTAVRSRRTAVGIALILGAIVGIAGDSHAQFFGAWLPPERSASLELWTAYTKNDQWFCGDTQSHCAPGDRDVLSDIITPNQKEESETWSMGVKAEIAPLSFLTVFAELPFHVLSFEQYSGDSGNRIFPLVESEGIGDLRLALRAGTSTGPWAVSGGYGIVFPTGDFSINAVIAPLGQGTRNHEFFAEAGRSLYPFAGYVQGGVLYRFRERFELFDIPNSPGVDWGNEFTAYLQGGWNFSGPWWAKLETKLFTSERFTVTDQPDPVDYRSVVALFPAVAVKHWGAFWEVWATLPVAGHAFPADPTIGFKVNFLYAAPRAQPTERPNP